MTRAASPPHFLHVPRNTRDRPDIDPSRSCKGVPVRQRVDRHAPRAELREYRDRSVDHRAYRLDPPLTQRHHLIGVPRVQGRELANASAAKVVRVVDGETIITDGPFAETKEQLGGLFVTELPDLDEAIRLAALVPAAEYGTLEIRPLATR